jgi:hypothetical protein
MVAVLSCNYWITFSGLTLIIYIFEIFYFLVPVAPLALLGFN